MLKYIGDDRTCKGHAQVWTCKFNRTWMIKQLLQYKRSNKVTYSYLLRKPRCSCAVGWYLPVEKQQQTTKVFTGKQIEKNFTHKQSTKHLSVMIDNQRRCMKTTRRWWETPLARPKTTITVLSPIHLALCPGSKTRGRSILFKFFMGLGLTGMLRYILRLWRECRAHREYCNYGFESWGNTYYNYATLEQTNKAFQILIQNWGN